MIVFRSLLYTLFALAFLVEPIELDSTVARYPNNDDVTEPIDDLNARIAEAIEETRTADVIYNDVLGEGINHWDADPRYPSNTVNCIVWIRQVISEAYGKDLDEKIQIMDHLRYYGGHIGFSMRKHFNVRWLQLDPGPLKEVNLAYCAQYQSKTVQLDFKHFLKSHQFSCPMYLMDEDTFSIKYLKPADLLSCMQGIAPGYYILFGVPSEYYIEKYGSVSGPMGLVHGMIVKVSTNQEPIRIFHASIARKGIKEEDLKDYIKDMSKRLHAGYVVYRLDPAWNYKKKIAPDLNIQELRECERVIDKDSKPRSKF